MLCAALDQDERGWVADGNYDGRGGLFAFEDLTHGICQLMQFFYAQFINHDEQLARLMGASRARASSVFKPRNFEETLADHHPTALPSESEKVDT